MKLSLSQLSAMIKSAGAAISLTASVFLATGLLPGREAFGKTNAFRRGDANNDAQLNLTDALHVLGYLFLGRAQSLDCQDAADANDDGQVNLSDAVHLLRHLFQGGPAPPAPFPDCGVDPTADGLDCVSSVLCPQCFSGPAFDPSNDRDPPASLRE